MNFLRCALRCRGIGAFLRQLKRFGVQNKSFARVGFGSKEITEVAFLRQLKRVGVQNERFARVGFGGKEIAELAFLWRYGHFAVKSYLNLQKTLFKIR